MKKHVKKQIVYQVATNCLFIEITELRLLSHYCIAVPCLRLSQIDQGIQAFFHMPVMLYTYGANGEHELFQV